MHNHFPTWLYPGGLPQSADIAAIWFIGPNSCVCKHHGYKSCTRYIFADCVAIIFD